MPDRVESLRQVQRDHPRQMSPVEISGYGVRNPDQLLHSGMVFRVSKLIIVENTILPNVIQHMKQDKFFKSFADGVQQGNRPITSFQKSVFSRL